MLPRILLVALTVSSSLSWASEPDIPDCIAKTISQSKLVESVVAFKLNATVKIPEFPDDVVWMEVRGEKIFVESLLAGRSEKRTFLFDGKRMIVHEPRKNIVQIETKERFSGPIDYSYLFPASWTSIGHSLKKGKSSNSFFLHENLANSTSKWIPDTERIRFSYYSKSPNPAFKTKWLEIDPQKTMVVASEASGGKALSHRSEYEWTKDESGWYVSMGKVLVGDRIRCEWKVDSYSCDARLVRSSFTLDESKLPFGTRVDEEPNSKQSPRKIRFVGGDEGKKEYDLRMEAR